MSTREVQGLSKWLSLPKGKEGGQNDRVKTQECSEPAAGVMSNAPVKDITSCDCVKLGCGTCINHEKRIERLEFDLTTLRSQLFFPNESEIARDTENALRFALIIKALDPAPSHLMGTRDPHNSHKRDAKWISKLPRAMRRQARVTAHYPRNQW